MKKALAIVVALMMVMALIPVTSGAEAAQRGRLESGKVQPSKSIATRDEIVTDASLLNENFDDTSAIGDWWLYDADGDDTNWGLTSNANFVYGGSGYAMISYSYMGGTVYDADNWLVTPDLTIPAGDVYLTFQAKDQDPNYLDSLQVLVGEEGEAYDDSSIYPDAWTTIRALAPLTGEYTQYAYSLSQFAGQTVAIAFRHCDSDMFYCLVDEVQVGIAGEITEVTGVTVTPATLALEVTGTAQLTATVAPSDATFPKVTWASSDPTVAAVNKMGGVMGLAAGTAVITATASNGVYGSCTVTVTAGDNDFAVPMVTYGIYDLDTGNSPYNWYTVDQYGAMELAIEDGTNYFVRPAWHAVNGLVYAYVNNDSSYDFVSIDLDTETVTTIASGLTSAPWWMSYAWDTNTMYGGFMSFDADDNIAGFNISTIDLATGLEDEVLCDVYNYVYTYTDDNNEEQSVQVGFLPIHATYAGGGYFIGADYQYNDIIFYAPDNGDLNFGWLTPDEAALTDQYGAVPTYIEAIYYNPFDGMLYWECPINDCDMAIFDLENGIIVPTGITGLEGAEGGIECSGLFAVYTLTQTYTVSFYDSITGELIAAVEVEEGGAAEAPAAPEHEGYTFTGWDADFSNVTADMDVYAVYEQNPAGLIGDVDLNGTLTMADVALLYQIVLGQADVTAEAMANADVDGNGNVAMGDVAALYQIVLGN